MKDINLSKFFIVGIVFSLFSSGIQAQLIEELGSLAAIGEMGDIEDPDGEETRELERSRLETEKALEERESKRLKEGEKFGFSGSDDFIVGPQKKAITQPKKYFGYDYFEDSESTFIVDDISVPADYILGPGDEVRVTFYGGSSLMKTLKVSREGDISVPELGPIYVSGLSFSEMKRTIEQTVESQLIGTNVNVTLGALKTINIFVLGEALKPGMFTVSGMSSLTNAIFSSGGIKYSGSLRNIQLKRKGQVITNFDFYKLLLEGDTSEDVNLIAGDVIFIPPATKQVAIVGEVNRPAIYELVNGESAADLIRFAGGTRVKAKLDSIEIQRVDIKGNGYNLIRPDLNGGSFSGISMKDGDTLSVNSVPDKMNAAILLSGHAQNPGYYPWFEGMRLSDVIASDEDLLPMTDLNYLLIKRENEYDSSIEVHQVSIQEHLNNPNSEENIFLRKRDELIFFPSQLSIDLIKTTQISITDFYENNDDEAEGFIFAKQSLEDREQDYLLESGMNQQLLADQSLSRSVRRRQNPVNEPTISSSRTVLSGGETDEIAELEEDILYYKYDIYDYCELWDEQISSFISNQRSLAKLSISAEVSIDDFKNKSSEIVDDDNYKLTQICRKQLIKPIVELIQNQSSPERNQQIIEVYGNVSFPGKYPLPKDADIKDALAASGGLKDMTFLREIEISRKSIEEKEIIQKNIPLNYSSDNSRPLMPLDIITVKKFSDQVSVVELEGEVYFPGTYPIAEDETFTQLINRAGGLTSDANTKNIIYTRENLARQELERLEQASRELQKQILLTSSNRSGGNNDMAYLDRLSLLTTSPENIDLRLLGRLVFDAQNVLSGATDDIELKDGDRIIIPRSDPTVAVIGEVFAPNSHFYNESFNLDDYIDLSGGSTKFSDVNSSYLIKGNGSVYPLYSSSSGGFFRSKNVSIEPGDTIVVPLEIKSYEGIRAATEITQIIYQIGLAAAAVNSL